MYDHKKEQACLLPTQFASLPRDLTQILPRRKLIEVPDSPDSISSPSKPRSWPNANMELSNAVANAQSLVDHFEKAVYFPRRRTVLKFGCDLGLLRLKILIHDRYSIAHQTVDEYLHSTSCPTSSQWRLLSLGSYTGFEQTCDSMILPP